jgi:hypothetical protein
VWLEEKPHDEPEQPESKLSFEEHCEGFKGVRFGAHYHTRIMWTLYDLHIHSLEELAKTPPVVLLIRRSMGRKSLACIRTVLESRGVILGKDWDLAIKPAPDISRSIP